MGQTVVAGERRMEDRWSWTQKRILQSVDVDFGLGVVLVVGGGRGRRWRRVVHQLIVFAEEVVLGVTGTEWIIHHNEQQTTYSSACDNKVDHFSPLSTRSRAVWTDFISSARHFLATSLISLLASTLPLSRWNT